ncbi:hypothetical protein TEA_022982 [Camellia sinensis var. sinensis]|uniref:mitogen-activated protein kinase kinase n=1 Tax=Camellia sinensis var. sinensis TaxID=542762 RepID=A0A4V3WNH3_CAMSN|nr:hypothetical protein TEA_022982 [Camellia sinensis var. sinensis]
MKHKKESTMKLGTLCPNLNLKLPSSDEQNVSKFLTKSGTFVDGDLRVNKYGVRIPPLIQPLDNQICLADFDAIKVVGKGTSGIVRLVQHKWTRQFFALKVIQMSVEESTRKQIAQELKINLSTQCPYVVLCYQCFYDNGAISIVLEYMDGGSLADFLKKVKIIPEPYLAAICKQVGTLGREVKITDFGVSTILASTSGQANTLIGTYNYMSPERIRANRHGYRSDIWSLGVILLECAVGQFPYSPPQEEGWTTVFELMETIVEQPPPVAPADQFSSEFCSFISECVQKDPNARRSANELLTHPFITMFEDLDIDLASYFTHAGCPLTTF